MRTRIWACLLGALVLLLSLPACRAGVRAHQVSGSASEPKPAFLSTRIKIENATRCAECPEGAAIEIFLNGVKAYELPTDKAIIILCRVGENRIRFVAHIDGKEKEVAETLPDWSKEAHFERPSRIVRASDFALAMTD